MLGQHARDVVFQAAAGDVRHSEEQVALDGREQGLDVNFRRGQQGGADGLRRVPGRGVGVRETRALDDFAHERVAVGVRAVASKTEQDLAFFHLGGEGQDFAALLESAGRGARGVELFALVHAGHFGGFAAYERAAGIDAAAGDTLDESHGVGHRELRAGVVVHESEGFGALDDEVVDVHGDEVDADCTEVVDGKGDFQLGADAVDGLDEGRGLGVAGCFEVEGAAEAADVCVCAGAAGGFDGCFDGLDELVAGVDGDAGVGVGHSCDGLGAV